MGEAAQRDNGGDSDPLVTVGRIVREWGIKGEVLVTPLTFSPERFFQLRDVAVQRRTGRHEDGRPEVAVEWKRLGSVRSHGDHLVLTFEDCEDPEEARRYRAALLRIKRSESPPLPEGTYYHYQIIGLAVYTVEGNYLGEVVAILETGSNDVYVVRGDLKEHLIPAVKDVVLQIDLDAKKITVKLMESVE